jgi:hypothetical protein
LQLSETRQRGEISAPMDYLPRPSEHAALLVERTRQQAHEVHEAVARARQAIRETMALIAEIDATAPRLTAHTDRDR